MNVVLAVSANLFISALTMSAPLKPDAVFLAEVEEFLLSCDLPTFPSLQALDADEMERASTMPIQGAGKRNDTNVFRSDPRTPPGRKPLSADAAAAKLDLERTKDRKRRSAYRERQRQEKEHLRQEIGKLTEELGHLQNTKERNTLAMPVYWEMMAKRQLQARLNAEAEQRRLYTVIDSQAALIHEFRSYVNEHTKDDSKELLDSDTYCQHKTLCVEPSDVEFYQAYVLDLDALYAKTSTVLSSCVLDKTTACWDDLKQQWREEGTSDFYTFVDVQIVPFGFKETSDTLWTVGRLLHRQEDRQAYHGLPNTVAFKFRYTTQLKSGRVVSVLQRVVSRRYDEDGKTVVVWRSFTEGEGMFTGMHADETGWCVTTPLTSSSLPGTLVRVIMRHVPMHFSSASTHDDASKQFTGLMLETGTEDATQVTKALEKLLLNELLANSSLLV